MGEVGCHEGMTTAILAERCSTSCVLGLDRSVAAVAAARCRFPRLHFEVLDILQQPRLELRLPSGHLPNVAFLDLGGDMRASAVLRAIIALETLPRLRLLVTKSQVLREAVRATQVHSELLYACEAHCSTGRDQPNEKNTPPTLERR